MRHFLRLADLNARELRSLLDLAREVKQSTVHGYGNLAGRSVALIFEKPSTRTRLSIAVAANSLGMAAQAMGVSELQLARGETVRDTARAVSQYVDLIVFRTFGHERLEEFATASQVPVINGLSNDHHPCQALADLLTIEERLGGLRGRRIAFVGDASSNVAQSLLEAAALTGMILSIATPEQYHPAPSIIALARRLAKEEGAEIEIHDDPFHAVENADAVYPEVWVPMDREDERAKRAKDLSRYTVDRELLARAKPSAICLHCLPAFRGQEVTDDVLDDPASAVWQQAGNRLPTSQALMLWILGAAEL
jgi:ornithine carbamoyltransferase